MKKIFSNPSKLLLTVFVTIIVFLSLVNISTAKEQYAYITNSGNQSVTIIDLENLTKKNLFLGFTPYYINKIPGYDQLWIYSSGYSDSYLRVIDPSTGTLLFQSTIRYLKRLAVSSDGTHVFVAHGDNPVQITVLRTDDFSEIRNFPIVALNYLQDFDISNNSRIIYATYSNNFFIINANDGNIISAVPLSRSATGFLVSPKEDYAYVYSDYWNLDRINLNTLDVKTVTTNRDIEALAISHDGRFLYAALDYDNNVNVYNAESLSLVTTIQVGSQDTRDLNLSSDDSLLYVLNQNNPNFEIYECQTSTRVAAMYTGSNTYDFDFDYPPSDSIKPQPVSNVQVLNIYNDGALLSWTAASDDSITEPVRGYDVRYDTVAISDINQAKIYPHSVKPSAPGETDSLKMTGLNEETKYWAAIRTYDEAKNFSDSVIVEFTTLKAPKISVSPDSFDFSVSIGDTVEKSLTITNAGGTEAGVLDFKIQVNVGKESTIQFAYVANSGNGTISVIDILHSTQRTLNIGNKPYEVKKSPISNDLWLGDKNRDLLTILDASTGKVKNSFSLDDIEKIQFSIDGGRAYILCGRYGTWIKVFDTIKLTEISSFSITSNYGIYDFALSYDGQYIYTMDNYYFYVYDALNGNKISSTNLNYRTQLIEISPDDRYAYLCGESNLLKVDLQNMTAKHNSIGPQVSSFAIAPDGKRLYIGFTYSSSVLAYSTETLTQVSSIYVKNDRITDIKVSPDMKYLYVLHQDSPNLGIYDLETGRQLESFSTGYNSYRFDISEASLPYIQIDPKSGAIAGGQAETVTLTIYSEYLFHKIYAADIIIKSNDPDNPTTKVPFIINSQDTKPPDFNMAFFVNPYLTNNLKVMIFSHEFLPELPKLFAGDSDELSLALHDSAYYIYLANYKLTTSEDITFTVTGSDSLGNSSTFQRTLRVTNVPLGKATVLSNLEGELTIKFASGSFDQEKFIILWEDQADKFMNKIYHLGPNFLSLKNSATIEIHYSDINSSITNPHHLSFYQKNIHDQWEKILSRIDKDRKVITADIIQLGVFKVDYDESNFSDDFKSIPGKYRLSQNYPNPFNPETTIEYQLPQSAEVSLTIYNIQGKEVRRLVYETKSAGYHRTRWDGRDQFGQQLASGMYFYRIKAKALGKKELSFIDVKKMILMK